MRKIIHCDCDCFYAAVEMRDTPSWRGKPLAVGGRPESRGVVATCNYEARAFGIRSAMSMAKAHSLCPELLIIPPDFARYRAVSNEIFAIYHRYTPLIEPLSLDEAFLDVSTQPHCDGSATRMAQEIRRCVADEVGITVSAGVAPNKFLAKIASDWRKPDGLFVIKPTAVDAFVAQLPVGKLFGVGKVTEKKLHAMSIFCCADLQQYSAAYLQQHFGKFGLTLSRLSRGIDERAVTPSRERKSLSVETTYRVDLTSLVSCEQALAELFATLQHRLTQKTVDRHTDKAFIKIKFADFSHTTAECVISNIDTAPWRELLQQGYARGQGKAVRLLGVGVRFATKPSPEAQQLALF